MRRIYATMTVLAMGASCFAPEALAETEVPSTEGKETLKIFDEAIFFDGYNTLENISDESKAMIPENDGILRHSTSLYAVRLTEEQLSKIGESLTMLVEIGALCDNYDRIGNIDLALVPKGDERYNPDEVQRIELGRFITPFMNKNREPSTVPYVFEVDNVSLILRDERLRAAYDIWAEFELFGVPYAANQQVKGCADRQDVFTGTLTLITDAEPAPATDKNVLVPVVMKKPEYKGGNLNNYGEGCTDEPGKTDKTWNFDLPEDVTDGQIVYITSNHGANSGGEEYNRREHFVYFDNNLSAVYTPGRESCEPFRMYNTQSNGIYGFGVKTDESWQSFSNWCPGDKIDIRILNVGPLSKGEHSFRINVPAAKFADKQGDIPVSIYFQGVTEGSLPAVASVEAVRPEFRSAVRVEDGYCYISSEEPAEVVTLCDVSGRMLAIEYGVREISLADAPKGVLVLLVDYADGLSEAFKIIH